MSLVFVKLGGSLVTDKSRPRALRAEVIARLAAELAAAAGERPGALVVGHGSGSYGHAAAARWRLHEGVRHTAQLPGICETQDLAARLHRRVVAALLEAGALAYGLAPSSFLVSAEGRPQAPSIEALAGALGLGLLPVVYGDVVMDTGRGAAICSTETLFESLVDPLAERGLRVTRALWLGETDGILDGDGRTVERVTRDTAAAVLEATGGSRGIDVTGGMRHRLETALRLAGRGVESLILDGRRPGVVARALSGEESSGTVVAPTSSPPGLP